MSDPSAIVTPVSRQLTALGNAVAQREQAKIYQFPLWPDPERGIPNAILRSALFAAVQGAQRRQMRAEPIASQGKYTIEFTGVQLTQSHLDVFEGIAHLARGAPEGNLIRFSARGLLRLIGRHTGRSEHDWLYLMLNELVATSVAIREEGKKVFFGSLITSGVADLERGSYAVKITRELIQLFETGFTQIEWEQRRKLKQKPLACWLQLYYSSHARPYPVTVEFLHKQCGANGTNLRKFQQNLKAALKQITDVGVISAWQIEKGKVSVERCPTLSQQRYIASTRA